MYNNYVMDGKTPILWFLRTALGLILLIGLSPISHFLSMQSGHMQRPSQTGTLASALSTGQNMPPSCCNDTIGSFHLTCGFVVPHSAFATHSAGIDQVAILHSFFQVNFREITTPPPKI